LNIFFLFGWLSKQLDSSHSDFISVSRIRLKKYPLSFGQCAIKGIVNHACDFRILTWKNVSKKVSIEPMDRVIKMRLVWRPGLHSKLCDDQICYHSIVMNRPHDPYYCFFDHSEGYQERNLCREWYMGKTMALISNLRYFTCYFMQSPLQTTTFTRYIGKSL